MIRLAALAGFLLGAVALVPLRLILPEGLAATRASGTVWNGHLEGASWRGVNLGTLDIALQPLALFVGQARLKLSGPDLTGTLILGQGVEALSGQRTLAGLPITSLTAQDLTLRFEGGQCAAASGSVSASLPGSTGQLGGPLSGVPRCTGSSASLSLASPDGLSTLSLTLSASGQLSVSP
jgi:hypothetical protein